MPEQDLFAWKPESCQEDYSVPPDGAYVAARDSLARKVLPAKSKHKTLKIFGVVKQLIGKDLTRIALPVSVNEPLSMLQRIAESLEYGYLLDKADQADDAILRMELLMAFCVSCLSSSKDRSLKPFNPVLGETFQLETPDSRCIAEQISHHPPISAFHAQGKQFTVYCNLQPRVVFWGMSLEVDPNSNHVITLKRHNEHYFWTGVPIIIKSILFGTPHLEYDGVLEIRKHNSTLRGILDFAAGNRAKSSDVERTRVVGTIFDGERKLRNLKGFWADHLMSTSATGPDFRRASAGANSGGFHRLRNPADEQVNKRRSNHQKVRSSGSSAANKTNRQKSQANSTLKIDKCDPGDSQNDRLLFKMTERPPKSSDYFSFSYFALTLNQLRREPGSDICATDSRFRPDLRLFEEGKEQQSEEARDRLRQRAHENRNKNNTTTTAANEGTTSTSHHPHKPRWFVLRRCPVVKTDMWMYDEETKFFNQKNPCADVATLW